MLPISTVEEINRLVKEGRLSQRKIAARLGVSRSTVGALASGRRGLFGKAPGSDDEAAHVVQSPPTRCPHCGFKVYLPCLVCRTREYRHAQKLLRAAAAQRGVRLARAGRVSSRGGKRGVGPRRRRARVA